MGLNPALPMLCTNSGARITLAESKRSSPHSPEPEGLILSNPPPLPHLTKGSLTPASSSSRRVSGVSLEAIWAATSAQTCRASHRRRCQLRASGLGGLHPAPPHPTPGPAPIPFASLTPLCESRPLPPPCRGHLLPGSSPCFVFPKPLPFPGTGWPFLSPQARVSVHLFHPEGPALAKQ